MKVQYLMFITFIIDETHDQHWWELQCESLIQSLIKEFNVNNYIGFLRKIDCLDFTYFSFHIGIDKFIDDIDKLNSIWFKDGYIDYSANSILTFKQQKLKLESLKNNAVKVWTNNSIDN
jgi:hypothetical protein